MFNRIQSEKMLFVWDGTRQSICIADQILSSRKKMSAKCILVIPHESICACPTAGHSELEPGRLEQEIHSQFHDAAAVSNRFPGSKLEIVFGDRIREVLRYSEAVKANLLLMPKFTQSPFSNWIHGDLNRRVADSATCAVFLYDADAKTWSPKAQPSEQDKTNQ